MAKDYYKRTYGVTRIQVLKQLLRQHRACAICECYLSQKGKNIFHLDHCHETGKPRGLVCRSCNRLIGKEDKRIREMSRSLGFTLYEYVKYGGIWREADFEETNHSKRVTLHRCNGELIAQGADIRTICEDHAGNLSGAGLVGANLENANLCGADLSGANLERAELVGANLESANLENANLIGADLTYAQLCGANFYKTDLRDARLTMEQFRIARMKGAYCHGVHLVEIDNG